MAVSVQNNITYGLSNGKYAVATNSTGTWSFGAVKDLPNLQEFNSSVIGSKNNVYADNKVVASPSSISGIELTVKLSTLTDEFLKDVLGYVADSKGNLCEVSNAEPKTFALGFQLEGDKAAKRVWFFLCSATHPGEKSSTNTESITANDRELSITVRPLTAGDYEVLKSTSKKGDTDYETFLNTCTIPTFG